jgi:hypothetical protein
MADRSKNSTGYQESLGKVLGHLKEKSSPQELLLGELFTRIYNFERQVENLKVSLFRQADIADLDFTGLYQSLFRQLDYSS